MKAVSLFSGAGGMDVGAIRAGFEVVAASEIDAHACSTYRRNHPGTVLIEGDIDKRMSEIMSFKGVDLVIGGPPCQGFSVAGKMDPSDPRSKLVFSFCSVVEKLLPRAFVMENVKALGKLAKFEDVRREIIRRMRNAGYQTTVHILNAKDFGVPQSRERVFFIGTRACSTVLETNDFEKFKQEAISLRHAIAHLGRAGSLNNSPITKAKITLAKKPVLRKSPYAGMLFNGQGRPLNPDAWSSTLPASMGGNRTPIIDEEHLYGGAQSWVEEHHRKILSGAIQSEYKEAPSRLRRLTIREAAVLQSFPESYCFEGPQSRIFSQIGNAVPCKLAESVLKAVKHTLSNTATDLRIAKQSA
ncbi:DNA cytosine methyltransferase [Varunaivibrio sulfuroxidans]|uniref:Cytosine-specific methyltransferase n=1 Tax=Varunaivibrio sulfuroxidans TaxID=1773489 RepID=A0A4R3J6S2_9PROT|nr:DNA cytosine methyltransferase [Varunaivibrio sulfuroxidans]TCS61599.1 DNA (cytosine-5)-methyltransferase 1 [Varunaivibrio sulfuroxidans]WES29526.1 DNA cytosine methyltransferase [Varunaivibrio sulfuroxidans]